MELEAEVEGQLQVVVGERVRDGSDQLAYRLERLARRLGGGTGEKVGG